MTSEIYWQSSSRVSGSQTRIHRGPERASSSVAAASDEIDRELQLTSQLFAFTRERVLPTHVGNVNEHLKALELLRPFSDGPGLPIVLELASDIPMRLLDSSQLNAAIIILVVNARDAMPNGGGIQMGTVRWELKTATHTSPAPGTYVRVRVKDSGSRNVSGNFKMNL